MRLEKKVKIINFFSLIVIGLIVVVMCKKQAEGSKQQTEIDALHTRIAADQAIGSHIPELQHAIKVLEQKNTELRGTIEKSKQERAREQADTAAPSRNVPREAADRPDCGAPEEDTEDLR